MVGFVNSEETKILEWYFAAGAMTPEATKYLGLFSAPGSDAGTYTEVTVSEWDTYARLEVTSGEWGTAVGGDPSYIQNTVKHTWVVSGGGTGVLVTHWGLFDVQTINTGNMRFHGLISLPSGGLQVDPGVQPEFAVGAFRARLGDLPAA